jgi:Spy/CpxP family protein refolding chaperone
VRKPTGVLVLGLIALAGAVQAQPGGPGAGPRRSRDEAHKMVDAYIVSNLLESLGLSEDQYVKVLPLVNRLQKDRREYTARRMEALQEMRRLLQSGGATEARVSELLKEVKSVEIEAPSVQKKDLDAIDALLTPVQQAKFRILEIEVERKIREIMGQMRAPGRLGGRRRPDIDSQP